MPKLPDGPTFRTGSRPRQRQQTAERRTDQDVRAELIKNYVADQAASFGSRRPPPPTKLGTDRPAGDAAKIGAGAKSDDTRRLSASPARTSSIATSGGAASADTGLGGAPAKMPERIIKSSYAPRPLQLSKRPRKGLSSWFRPREEALRLALSGEKLPLTVDQRRRQIFGLDPEYNAEQAAKRAAREAAANANLSALPGTAAEIAKLTAGNIAPTVTSQAAVQKTASDIADAPLSPQPQPQPQPLPQLSEVRPRPRLIRRRARNPRR